MKQPSKVDKVTTNETHEPRESGLQRSLAGQRSVELRARSEPDEEGPTPSQVRELVLAEHMHIRRHLGAALESAHHVLQGRADAAAIASMLATARAAYTALVAHTQLEDQTLAPVLETIDAWGPVRAENLRQEHSLQRRALERALSALDHQPAGAMALAAAIEDLLRDVELDMQREESELLESDLLRDGIIVPNMNGG